MKKFVKISIVAGALAIGAALAASAIAAAGPSSVPGWGFGDKNHVHTGPPGQSTHP